VFRAQHRTSMKTRNFITFYEFLPHIGLHHTTGNNAVKKLKQHKSDHPKQMYSKLVNFK
jgi:hypothetical protein